MDGTGRPAREAHVLLRGGRIAHVGPLDPDTVRAAHRVDAGGKVVAPGFIDLHHHGDPLESARFPNALAMGVTTILLGQDGSSPEAGTMEAHLRAVEDAGLTVNVGYLVGHNTVRGEAGVGFAEADAEGRRRMAGLVEEALRAGVWGLSLGLEYDPGTRADLEELEALARPVSRAGGFVAAHLRSEDRDRVAESLEELLEVGRRSGARVHASHLKVVLGDDPGQAHELLEAMARARRDGVAATGDVYPYTASFTGLSILFPDWARPPNDFGSVLRMRRDELARHLRERVESRNGPEATLFGTGPWAGRTLAEAAGEEGRPFEDLLLDLGPGGARAAYFVMDEAVMAAFLADPHLAVASDGSPTMAHPRGYGTFPRVLERWVRREGHLTLEEAVRKMTGLPASIAGLDRPEEAEPAEGTEPGGAGGEGSTPDRVVLRRGLLLEGWAADVVLFDPERVRDRATYMEPHRLAEGIHTVWVGGEPAWEDGAPVAEFQGGTVLRRR